MAVWQRHSQRSASLRIDGKPDLVTGHSPIGGGTGSITILLGRGNGTFRSGGAYGGNGGSGTVAIGDVNRDGLPDLVNGNPISSTVTARLGVPGGGFGAKIDRAAVSDATGVAVGDLNRDGKPDIVAASGPNGTASMLLGTAIVP